MTLLERVKEVFHVNRVRAFRFPGEQANHEQQARETEVSLGLMADAAEKSDDDSILHVLGSEAAHRARLARLNALDRELGGLTPTQQGERQSIIKALGELQERREALSGDTPVDAPKRFGLGAFSTANPLLGVLTSTPALIAIAFAIPALGGAVQTWRLNHAKHDLQEARADLTATQRDLAATQAERDLAVRAANNANHDNAETAQLVEAERTRRLRAEREARRIRDAMEQARAGGSVDYGFGGVRDTGSPATPGGGDAAGNNPR